MFNQVEKDIINEALELSEDCYLPSMSKSEYLHDSVQECITIGVAHRYPTKEYRGLMEKLSKLSEKQAAKIVAEARLP